MNDKKGTRKLAKFLKSIDTDSDTAIPIMILADKYALVDETLKYANSEKNVDGNDILGFLIEKIPEDAS